MTHSVQDALRLELLERELCRRDLHAFVARLTPRFLPGGHMFNLAKAVERIETKIQRRHGTDARLIVEVPPRHGKTQTISNCSPLWYLGRHPEQEVIVSTYNQERADEIGRQAKHAVQDPVFKNVFPDLEIRTDSRAANRLGTVQGGGIKYVGVGSGITGSGADLIIIDDPIKDSADADSPSMAKHLWEWYSGVLRTRLAPGGGIIVLHTRWRVTDLIGRLKHAMKEGGGEEFECITYRALAEDDDPLGRAVGEPLHPERYNAEDLEALRRSLLPRDWMALYQQRPLEETGAVFSPQDFHTYKPGSEPKNLHWHVACDGAFSTRSSADHSVIWPYGIDSDGCVWFSPDFVRARIDISVFMEELIRRLVANDAMSLTLEAGAFYRAIEPELKRRLQQHGVYCQILTPPATKDKYTRSRPLHAKMQQGLVKYPDIRRLHEVVIPEFLNFTGRGDKEDDIVDTCSWAAWAADRLIKPYTPDSEADVDEDDAQRPTGHANLWNMADIEQRVYTRTGPAAKHVPRSLFAAD